MKVFVTGGTGFIGGAVVRQLRARGDEVVCLARNPEKGKAAAELGCEIVAGDLADEGCDPRRDGRLRRGDPRRRDLRGRDPRLRAGGDEGGQRRWHRTGAGRGAGGEDREGRLRLDRRRLRQHPRQGRRRELRAPGQGVHLLLRADQVGSPPGRQAADRRGAALRDRAAGRRLRPRRHLLDRPAARPVPGREDAADPLPGPGDLPLARRGHRRRHPARARPGQARARPT